VPAHYPVGRVALRGVKIPPVGETINHFSGFGPGMVEKPPAADGSGNCPPNGPVGQVSERVSVGVGRHFMRRQQHGSWNGDLDLGGERVIEKFLIRAPPKRIVDYGGSGEGSILQKGAIERYVLRNAIDDYVVTARLSLNHFF